MALSQEDSLSEPSPINISALLHSPRKWMSEHLDLLKVRLIENVSAAELTDHYTPKDGDAGMYSTVCMILYPGNNNTDRLNRV